MPPSAWRTAGSTSSSMRWRAAPTLWRTRTSLAALGTTLVSGILAAWLFGPAAIGIGLQLGGLVGFAGLMMIAACIPMPKQE